MVLVRRRLGVRHLVQRESRVLHLGRYGEPRGLVGLLVVGTRGLVDLVEENPKVSPAEAVLLDLEPIP
jgi:hypothetical protein